MRSANQVANQTTFAINTYEKVSDLSTPVRHSSDELYEQANVQYWTFRSDSYSKQHIGELESGQKRAWSNELDSKISAAFPDAKREDLRVLEIGCGPGFFSIILAEQGYNVTAIDCTPSMLQHARQNARQNGQKIQFMSMDAESLTFPSESFDVVVSRNLTWDLPHPADAYYEWTRVLRPGGFLLNYDANWYRYLDDKDMRKKYEEDRQNIAHSGMNDRCQLGNPQAMENIAKLAPLTDKQRPEWDMQMLKTLGFNVDVDLRVCDRVWSKEELVSQASTPLFGIYAKKI